MLELAAVGRFAFQMRFQSNDDNYCMIISIYNNKIRGVFGFEYAVSKSFDSKESYVLDKFGEFEIEGITNDKIELVMKEILKQSVDTIMNYDIPLNLDDKKVKEFYIPLFMKFIKEKREG